MIEINYVAVAVSALVAFIAAGGYYAVFGKLLTEFGSAAADGERSPVWLLPVELVKHLVLAAVVGGLASSTGTTDWAGGVLLGAVLWIGFPVVLLASSVIHEKVPWKLAALHAGDWLGKLLLISVIVGFWS